MPILRLTCQSAFGKPLTGHFEYVKFRHFHNFKWLVSLDFQLFKRALG